jgi:hypothetical protein
MKNGIIILTVLVLPVFGCRSSVPSRYTRTGKIDGIQVFAPASTQSNRYPTVVSFLVDTPEYRGRVNQPAVTLPMGESVTLSLCVPRDGHTGNPFDGADRTWLDCELNLSRTNGRRRVWSRTVVKDDGEVQSSTIRVFIEDETGRMVEHPNRHVFSKAADGL